MREEGDDGYVLFDTRPTGPSYLYGVNYRRGDGRWMEGSSSNGGGWSQAGPDLQLGTLAFWDDDAPVGADRVRVEIDRGVKEEPVEDGVYLVVFWRVPSDLRLPRITFRIDGAWEH